jgi:hypothetical protein
LSPRFTLQLERSTSSIAWLARQCVERRDIFRILAPNGRLHEHPSLGNRRAALSQAIASINGFDIIKPHDSR